MKRRGWRGTEVGVSDEGTRESVLRVDGDGGQGKGHRLGTELGEERRNEKEIGKRAGERDR